jgi:hypothetical protein
MTPCTLVGCIQHNGESYCFHLQGTNLDGVIIRNIAMQIFTAVELSNSAIACPEDADSQFLLTAANIKLTSVGCERRS